METKGLLLNGKRWGDVYNYKRHTLLEALSEARKGMNKEERIQHLIKTIERGLNETVRRFEKLEG